jgi:hypothetical protein
LHAPARAPVRAFGVSYPALTDRANQPVVPQRRARRADLLGKAGSWPSFAGARRAPRAAVSTVTGEPRGPRDTQRQRAAALAWCVSSVSPLIAQITPADCSAGAGNMLQCFYSFSYLVNLVETAETVETKRQSSYENRSTALSPLVSSNAPKPVTPETRRHQRMGNLPRHGASEPHSF